MRWNAVAVVVAISLLGCVDKGAAPSLTASGLLTATSQALRASTDTTAPATDSANSPTSTHTPQPTRAATPTPPPTLVPDQAATTIRELLRTPECLAPCFWGISPGQSTFDEAQRVFDHLGLPLEFMTVEDTTEFYYTQHEFENGLSIGISLAVQDQRVLALEVIISPEIPVTTPMPREWTAYSPETLVRQYGPPSRVEIIGGMSHEVGADLNFTYYLLTYFDSADLIVLYSSKYDYVAIDPATNLVRICPVTDQFRGVNIWLGHNPEPPPAPAKPIEEAASLTVAEFSALMTGEPDRACFDVSSALFSN